MKAVRHVHGLWKKHRSNMDAMSPAERKCCADLWQRTILGDYSSVPPTSCTVEGAWCTAYGLASEFSPPDRRDDEATAEVEGLDTLPKWEPAGAQDEGHQDSVGTNLETMLVDPEVEEESSRAIQSSVRTNLATMLLNPEVEQEPSWQFLHEPADARVTLYGPVDTRQWRTGTVGPGGGQVEEDFLEGIGAPAVVGPGTDIPLFPLFIIANFIFWSSLGTMALWSFLRQGPGESREQRRDPRRALIKAIVPSGVVALVLSSCVIAIAPSGVVALVLSSYVMVATTWWTGMFDIVMALRFWAAGVVAVVAALWALWWGLHPAIPYRLRIAILPVELSLVTLIAAIADELLHSPVIPADRAGLTLGSVGFMFLAVPFTVDLGDRFQRWKSSVCMAAGTLAVWKGVAIFFGDPGPVQAGTGLKLLTSFVGTTAQVLWEVASWTFASLWPFVPAVEVAVASLVGSALVSWLLLGTSVVQETTGYCVCVLALMGIWSGFCLSAGLPPGTEGLAVPVLWLLGLVLIRLCLRVAFNQAASLWLFLAYATLTVAWTSLMETDDDYGLRYRNLKSILNLVWLWGMTYKVLIPATLKIERYIDAFAAPPPPPPPRRVGFLIPLADPNAPGPRAQ